jgi:hypothetical protein
MITAGVSLHDTGIDRKGFPPDQTGVHARPHHRVKYLAEQIAVAEPTVAIDQESRVVGNRVVRIEAAETSDRRGATRPPRTASSLHLKANAVAVIHMSIRIISSESIDSGQQFIS